MPKKKGTNKDEYLSCAKDSSGFIQRQAERLTGVGKNLAISPDFSPTNIEAMKQALAEMKRTADHLKKMIDISVNRGCTHYDEQKEKLLEGTLRIDRRGESDLAAE